MRARMCVALSDLPLVNYTTNTTDQTQRLMGTVVDTFAGLMGAVVADFKGLAGAYAARLRADLAAGRTLCFHLGS